MGKYENKNKSIDFVIEINRKVLLDNTTQKKTERKYKNEKKVIKNEAS